MTSRERVLAIARRQTPDRVPKDLSWGLSPAKQAEFRRRTGRDDYWEYFGLDIRYVDFAPTRQARDFSAYYAGRSGGHGFAVDEWGVGSCRSAGGDLHYVRMLSPLVAGMDEAQAESWPLPDFTAPYRHAHFAGQVAAWHQKGLAVGGALQQTVFEKAWAIRGFEEALMDLVAEPEALGILMERLCALRLRQARLLVEAGVDVLMLGDDVGMQTGLLLSAPLWRRHLKPLLARVIREAKRLRADLPVFYHSCGDCTEIIPDLIEAGVDILNPLQPECMDHAAIKAAYGDHLAFWGGVSAQTNLSFGTPRQVRDEVRLRIETLGRGGGYLVGPNHVVEPEVPWENLLAFFEAVEEYGRYT